LPRASLMAYSVVSHRENKFRINPTLTMASRSCELKYMVDP
jgi:hypothetical protein